jgi:hypothetical protein
MRIADCVQTVTAPMVRPDEHGKYRFPGDDTVHIHPTHLAGFLRAFSDPKWPKVPVFHIEIPVVDPEIDNFGRGWLVSLRRFCLHEHGTDTSLAATKYSEQAVDGEGDARIAYEILPVAGNRRFDATALKCLLECSRVDAKRIEEITLFDDSATGDNAARDRKRPRSQSE